MNKVQLLELIQNMPDDLEVQPITLSEHSEKVHDWVSQHRVTLLGGIYQQKIENEFTMTLRFTTTIEGEFRRTYENSTGTFFNVRRVK